MESVVLAPLAFPKHFFYNRLYVLINNKGDTTLNAKAAVKDIKQGQISPLYLCYGTEKYQIKQFVELLGDHVMDREAREFAMITFDLAETPVEVVVDEAETLPFLAERKLIIAQDSSIFKAGKDNGKINHNIERLLTYMGNPAEHSVIVFVVHGEKLDERKKIVKSMKSTATVLSFMPLGAEELVRWVIQQAEQYRCTMSSDAAEALIVNAGVQMQTLEAEVNKLCLHAGAGQTVQVQAVHELVARSTEQNIFVMVENIANLKLDLVFSTLYELIKQKEEPVKIVALIARQFRIMLQVKQLGGQSYSQQQIASQLGLHPYVVKLAGEQARKFEMKKLQRILSELAQLDYQMKSGKIDKVLGIEMFLLKLSA